MGYGDLSVAVRCEAMIEAADTMLMARWCAALEQKHGLCGQ
jgi:hypothetical protein